MNWNLISQIFSGLGCLENNCHWDLSVEEMARLGESFYESLKAGLPPNREGWVKIFNLAAIACWGSDHTCDEPSDKEIQEMVFAIFDMDDLREYLNQLGIKV